jgi:dihydroxyacetone kinase-like protein
MRSFPSSEGGRIVADLIAAVQTNKQRLSDIDGAIGDGDHGINMNKGFTQCAAALQTGPGDLAHSLRTLSRSLMMVGGSMGPLYGLFFASMAKACDGREMIDATGFGEMIAAAEKSLAAISKAKVGDKTLFDALTPAAAAYREALGSGEAFGQALGAMKQAAAQGRDSTIDMVAKIGRASRLGERSRGVVDPGAASCALILETMADTIGGMLRE